MKFSIITVTYNSEVYLQKTIESVLSQQYPELEYIVVDGGSTDGTLDMVKAYAEKDSRIVWVSETDHGIADAMNKGVQLATGDVLAHLHSDDYYLGPSVLQDVAKRFAEDDSGALWLTAGIEIVDETGSVLSEVKVRDYSYQRLKSGNIILHPATFLRKEAFAKVGLFDVSRKYAMDYDLWLRLGAISPPLTFDKSLACFRAHQGSLSTAHADSAFSEEWQIRKGLYANVPIKLIYHFMKFLVNKRINRNFIDKVLRGDV